MHADDPAVWILSVLTLLVVALIGNDAVLGRISYREFRAELDAADLDDRERVRAGFLLMWAWQPWVLATAAVGFIALVPGVDLRSIGFAWPDLSGLIALISSGGFAGGAALGITVFLGVALVAGLVAGAIGARRRAVVAPDSPLRAVAEPRSLPAAPVNAYVEPMLPTGRVDRRAWIVLSVTSGVTEEIMYRGLLLLVLSMLLPDASIAVTGGIAVVAFALAHVYQGWTGVLSTALLAFLFIGLYVSTGSILIGMLLHIAIDARLAFLRR